MTRTFVLTNHKGMALLASTDALIPVEPRYLETFGLMSALQKINDIH